MIIISILLKRIKTIIKSQDIWSKNPFVQTKYVLYKLQRPTRI